MSSVHDFRNALSQSSVALLSAHNHSKLRRRQSRPSTCNFRRRTRHGFTANDSGEKNAFTTLADIVIQIKKKKADLHIRTTTVSSQSAAEIDEPTTPKAVVAAVTTLEPPIPSHQRNLNGASLKSQSMSLSNAFVQQVRPTSASVITASPPSNYRRRQSISSLASIHDSAPMGGVSLATSSALKRMANVSRRVTALKKCALFNPKFNAKYGRSMYVHVTRSNAVTAAAMDSTGRPQTAPSKVNAQSRVGVTGASSQSGFSDLCYDLAHHPQLTIRHSAPNTAVSNQGETVNQVFLIMSGGVRLVSTDNALAESIPLCFLSASEVIGGLEVLLASRGYIRWRKHLLKRRKRFVQYRLYAKNDPLKKDDELIAALMERDEAEMSALWSESSSVPAAVHRFSSATTCDSSILTMPAEVFLSHIESSESLSWNAYCWAMSTHWRRRRDNDTAWSRLAERSGRVPCEDGAMPTSPVVTGSGQSSVEIRKSLHPKYAFRVKAAPNSFASFVVPPKRAPKQIVQHNVPTLKTQNTVRKLFTQTRKTTEEQISFNTAQVKAVDDYLKPTPHPQLIDEETDKHDDDDNVNLLADSPDDSDDTKSADLLASTIVSFANDDSDESDIEPLDDDSVEAGENPVENAQSKNDSAMTFSFTCASIIPSHPPMVATWSSNESETLSNVVRPRTSSLQLNTPTRAYTQRARTTRPSTSSPDKAVKPYRYVSSSADHSLIDAALHKSSTRHLSQIQIALSAHQRPLTSHIHERKAVINARPQTALESKIKGFAAQLLQC